MKLKFVRLPEGGVIRIDTIMAVRVFVDPYDTNTIRPRVVINYGYPSENNSHHSVSFFGSEDDARAFADSVIADIDEHHMLQACARSTAIEDCAQLLEARASQFYLNAPTTDIKIEKILTEEAETMRAMIGAMK